MRVVSVIPYDPQWPNLFAKEADKLKKVFGVELVDIHHIGSTSVPGLAAKPVVDMMPVVRDIGRIDRFDEPMIALGYEPCGESGIPGRRFFRKGGETRTHHVHAFQLDNVLEIDRHLAVRDYLRAYPGVAEKYGQLKSQLAQRFPDDIEGYMDGKNAFVREMERAALAWRLSGMRSFICDVTKRWVCSCRS